MSRHAAITMTLVDAAVGERTAARTTCAGEYLIVQLETVVDATRCRPAFM